MAFEMAGRLNHNPGWIVYGDLTTGGWYVRGPDGAVYRCGPQQGDEMLRLLSGYGNQAPFGARQQAAQQQVQEHTLGGAVVGPMYGGLGYELRHGTGYNDVNPFRQTYDTAIAGEAAARAQLLLAESLTQAERDEASAHNRVTVTGASGTRYRVRTNDGRARVEMLNDNDAVMARACVYPLNVPSADAVLAKILHLKTDDAGLMRVAVVERVAPVPLPPQTVASLGDFRERYVSLDDHDNGGCWYFGLVFVFGLFGALGAHILGSVCGY